MSKMFVSASVIYCYPTFVFYVLCFTNQSYKLQTTTTTKNYLTDFLKILCISSFIDTWMLLVFPGIKTSIANM